VSPCTATIVLLVYTCELLLSWE